VLQQLGEVVKADGDVGMDSAVGSLVDGQSAAHEGLGLCEVVGVLQELGQVAEGDRDVGMVGTVRILMNRQRPPEQRFGLGIASALPQIDTRLV
jgi:hypothetical protein